MILGERIFDGPSDHLAMADIEGSRAATEHLLAAGRRPIAMLADVEPEPDSGVASLRFHGYRDALGDAGITVDPGLVVAPRAVTMPAGRDAVRELLDRGHDVDAVFCLTDTRAIGALRGLADAGLRVPDDVMVTGFDDILEARFTVPSLSTIDPGHDFMAGTAVQMLIERIETKEAAGPRGRSSRRPGGGPGVDPLPHTQRLTRPTSTAEPLADTSSCRPLEDLTDLNDSTAAGRPPAPGDAPSDEAAQRSLDAELGASSTSSADSSTGRQSCAATCSSRGWTRTAGRRPGRPTGPTSSTRTGASTGRFRGRPRSPSASRPTWNVRPARRGGPSVSRCRHRPTPTSPSAT